MFRFFSFVFVGLGVSITVESGIIGSGVGRFSGNILLLKLLRTFSLASKRNPTFFEKTFLDWRSSLFISLNYSNTLLCS